MKSKLIYRAEVEWGWLGTLMIFLIVFLNFSFLLLIFMTSTVFLFFGIPIFLLDIVIFPLLKSIMKRHEFELQTDSVNIKNKKIEWKRIKSISFQTGRLIYDRSFNTGFKLPVLQKIYILDKKGREYSAIIDVDYYSKKNRTKNNIYKISKFLDGMNKDYLIADWAEKR